MQIQIQIQIRDPDADPDSYPDPDSDLGRQAGRARQGRAYVPFCIDFVLSRFG